MNSLLKKMIAKNIVTYMLIFLITAILLIPIYAIAYNTTRNALRDRLTEQLQNNVNLLGMEMLSLDLYANSIVKRKELIYLSYLPDQNHLHMSKSIQLFEELQDSVQGHSTILTDVVINPVDSKYIINRAGVFLKDGFYGTVLRYDGMSRSEYETLIVHNRVKIIEQRDVYIRQINRTAPMLTLNYYSRSYLHTYYAISFLISRESIRNILMTPVIEQYGYMRLRDASGNLLFSEGGEDASGGDRLVLSLASAQKSLALEVGVENAYFAESVYEVKRTIAIYCLAAFAFSLAYSIYAGKKVSRPIQEYLSFIHEQDLPVMDNWQLGSLARCVRESAQGLLARGRTLEINIKQLRRQYKDSILLNLDNGIRLNMEQLAPYFQDEPVFQQAYVLVRLRIEGAPATTPERARQIYLAAHKALEVRFAAAYILLEPFFLAVVGVNAMTDASLHTTLSEASEDFNKEIDLNGEICFVVSDRHTGLDGFGAACREVRHMLHNSFAFMPAQGVAYYSQLPVRQTAGRLNAVQLNSLYEIIRSGSQEDLRGFMDSLFKRMKAFSLDSPEKASALCCYVTDILEAFNEQTEAGIEIGSPTQSITQTCEALYTASEALRRQVQKKLGGNDIKDEIISYIDENYRNPNLCLSMLSVKFGLTEPYISKMIKARTFLTYSEYVEQLRMDRAKELLRAGSQSVYEIAQMLGYENANTFFKAFKRALHVSPGTWRSMCLAQNRKES